jgi:release factor glutamine methyltransferase
LAESFAEAAFDIIVSNPPYVSCGDLSSLQREVRDHEPHIALFGGGDGLDAYRRFSTTADVVLKPGGWLLLEVGYNTSAAIKPLFQAGPWEAPHVYRDLAGWERVVAVRKATLESGAHGCPSPHSGEALERP